MNPAHMSGERCRRFAAWLSILGGSMTFQVIFYAAAKTGALNRKFSGGTP